MQDIHILGCWRLEEASDSGAGLKHMPSEWESLLACGEQFVSIRRFTRAASNLIEIRGV